jgi:hypothetical protein
VLGGRFDERARVTPAARRARGALAVVASCAIVAGCGGAGHAAAPTRERARPATAAGAITVVRRQRIDARLQEWTLRTTALDGPTRVRILLTAPARTTGRTGVATCARRCPT